MKRIYEVMKAMGTDPASFFKQVARGEIALIIESAAGDKLEPSLEFWRQVLLDNNNEEIIPTHSHFNTLDVMGFANQKLIITRSALNLLENCDGFTPARKGVFFSRQASAPYFDSSYRDPDILKISDIYTDYPPAQANTTAPADTVQADQPKPQTNNDTPSKAAKKVIGLFMLDLMDRSSKYKTSDKPNKSAIRDYLLYLAQKHHIDSYGLNNADERILSESLKYLEEQKAD